MKINVIILVMTFKNNLITIFCDGASKGNPGPGGWGAIVAYDNKVKELGGREEHTTNNKMELVAAIGALAEAKNISGSVVVHTDSSYVINGITKWVKGWEARGWKTVQKQDVLNQDLWKELSSLVDNREEKISWVYIGGHIGIAGNERVDSIASDLAERKDVTLFSGKLSDYEIDVLDVSYDETKKSAKSDSRKRNGAKAYSYVSEVGGVVMVHKTWVECEKRVKGVKARFKKALSETEEKAIVDQFSK